MEKIDSQEVEAFKLHEGNCLEVLPFLTDNSIDFIFSDPPYPYIEREYGYWTEETWMPMMQEVVKQSKRVLTSQGSAVFILQPNSEKVGKIRPWLWKFLAWVCEEWNMIQDVYWWNIAALPGIHVQRNIGLTRPSLKICVWIGNEKCYRNQNEILWQESLRNTQRRLEDRADREKRNSGWSIDNYDCVRTSEERGGTTPFNVLPIPNTNSQSSAGSEGHGAGTPSQLVNWWLRYCTQEGDTVLDMFNGSGTTGIEALKMGRKYIGIEQFPKYIEISKRRLSKQASKPISMNLWDE